MPLPPAAAAMLELEPDSCVWPVGEASWCGRQAIDGPYCQQHRHEAHAVDYAEPGPLERSIVVTPTLRINATIWAVRGYLLGK